MFSYPFNRNAIDKTLQFLLLLDCYNRIIKRLTSEKCEIDVDDGALTLKIIVSYLQMEREYKERIYGLIDAAADAVRILLLMNDGDAGRAFLKLLDESCKLIVKKRFQNAMREVVQAMPNDVLALIMRELPNVLMKMCGHSCPLLFLWMLFGNVAGKL